MDHQDNAVLGQINTLADEERALYDKADGEELTADERARLDRVGVTLDQCWDLLRQRRARRSAGLDPDGAEVRDAATVERYLS